MKYNWTSVYVIGVRLLDSYYIYSDSCLKYSSFRFMIFVLILILRVILWLHCAF